MSLSCFVHAVVPVWYRNACGPVVVHPIPWLCACSQKNYPMAVKMYRMALDQIPISGKEVRFKIMRNIGNAFVRLGQFQDAIQSYEAIMDGNPGRGDETSWS